MVDEEAAELLAALQPGGELTWDAFTLTWQRVARRATLGDVARDDHTLTDLLAQLRGDLAYNIRVTTGSTRSKAG